MSSSLIVLALALGAAPAFAQFQTTVQPLPARTDADRLADTMRQLAVSPQDVSALATAGELSLGLDDLTAAAGFFARADKVDPRNARVKAGEGALMVRSERPGEALRYFAQAESFGGNVATFAADRGLAFDLVGDPARAQQQYRVALKAQPQADETIRRYALSLGIAGKRDQALAELEPLIHKSDRAAWRSRAFILAMSGDQAGAERIATTMMPPGMAQGLLPFFQRLPTLPIVDRAFAVHFGEVRASAERMADARMAPTPAPLAPEPAVQVAAQTSRLQLQPQPQPQTRRSKRDRNVAPAVASIPTGQAQPQSQPPAYTPPAQQPTQLAMVQPLPQSSSRPRQVGRFAPAATAVPSSGTPLPGLQPTAPRSVSPVTRSVPTVILTSQPSAPALRVAAPAPAPLPAAPIAVAGSGSAAPLDAAAATSIARVDVPPSSESRLDAQEAPARAAVPVASAPSSRARASEDNILARIIAGLSIPASELGAAAPPRPGAAPAKVAAADPEDAVPARQARDRLAAQAAAEQVAADKAAADRKAALDKKAADRKAAAEKKALAAKKAAAEEKAEAAKEAAEQRKLERANPERIWVQVAGGANEDDLAKAWKATKAKAPDVFGSRGGWTTPLRATNRVLAGPFKTNEEARAFVNDLKKKGVSGFTFTSEAGQPVAKLPK